MQHSVTRTLQSCPSKRPWNSPATLAVTTSTLLPEPPRASQKSTLCTAAQKTPHLSTFWKSTQTRLRGTLTSLTRLSHLAPHFCICLTVPRLVVTHCLATWPRLTSVFHPSFERGFMDSRLFTLVLNRPRVQRPEAALSEETL